MHALDGNGEKKGRKRSLSAIRRNYDFLLQKKERSYHLA